MTDIKQIKQITAPHWDPAKKYGLQSSEYAQALQFLNGVLVEGGPLWDCIKIIESAYIAECEKKIKTNRTRKIWKDADN